MRRLQELIAENLVERLSGSQDTQRSVPHTDPPPLDPGPSSSLTAASVQTSDEASATGPLTFYFSFRNSFSSDAYFPSYLLNY